MCRIIATCGHEVASLSSCTSLSFKKLDREGNEVLEHGVYCDKCTKKYAKKYKIKGTKFTKDEWLKENKMARKPQYEIIESTLKKHIERVKEIQAAEKVKDKI